MTSPRIAVIDNYDSFTYNIVQYLRELGAETLVHRNDAIEVQAVANQAFAGVLLSPGPGRPEDAGITPRVISELAGVLPIFGVCLGHQAIAQHYGGRIVRAERLMHGRTSPIHHEGEGVFKELPVPFTATRYHSLIVDRNSVPDELEITAWTDDEEIMGLRHRELDMEGVQFHPESFLTEHGHALLENWLRRCAP